MSIITGDIHHLSDEYGFAFIKSGFEHVQEDLESDFRNHGIDVIGVRPVILSTVVVDYVYRDSLQEPFYPAMKRHLTTGPVLAMALHGEDQNTQSTLHDLKCGNNGLPCLRTKYASDGEPLPEDEIEAWYKGTHPDQDAITLRLTQNNVLHTADTSDEAVESLRLIGQHNPEFWGSTNEDDPRVRNLANYLTTGTATPIL